MSERNYWVLCDDNCKFEGMTKEQIIAAIAEATGATPTHIDDAFITKVKADGNNNNMRFWMGTEAEFNALSPAPTTHDVVLRVTTDGKMYVCSNDSTLDSLTNRVTTNENDIDSVEDSVDALTTRVTNAETAATALTNRVTTTENDINSVEDDVEDLNYRVVGVENAYSEIESRVGVLESGFSSLQKIKKIVTSSKTFSSPSAMNYMTYSEIGFDSTDVGKKFNLTVTIEDTQDSSATAQIVGKQIADLLTSTNTIGYEFILNLRASVTSRVNTLLFGTFSNTSTGKISVQKGSVNTTSVTFRTQLIVFE